MQVNWSGVFPAVTTKLKEDGSLDEEAIKRGLIRLLDSGVGGIVMMGMVGENASLTPEEKRTVLKIAKATIGNRVPIISGVAETTTAGAVQFARDAEAIGVDGLMVFPALTYKSDERETIAFYRAVARSTKLALMLYNNPRGYGVDLVVDVLDALKDEANIVCIKEESYDTTRVTDLFNAFGDRFLIFCGVDDLILESAALGVRGWVSGMANALPVESVELLKLASAGEFEKALKLYRVLTPLFHLDTHVKLVQYIKLAEHEIAGFSQTVRAPRLPLEGAELARVSAIVAKTRADLALLGR
jgi:4-hydroxy-tetrahydrodipicolinate synthase